MSRKETIEVMKDAPRKDAIGRDLVVEAVRVEVEVEAIEEKERREEPEPEKRVRVAVEGLVIEADDSDGAGLARALATLAGMQPEVKG
jgi:hypothetical protein